MSYCPNCGKEVDPNKPFCPSCGASIAATSQKPPMPNSTVINASPQATVVPITFQAQTANIQFDASASRLELFVRILWYFLNAIIVFAYGLVFGIIIAIYGFVAGILNFINFWIILITGKRWKTAFDWSAKLIQKAITYYARLFNFALRRAPYMGLMIDQRPKLTMEPEPATTTGGSPA